MKALEAIDPRGIFLSPAQTVNEASRILIDNGLMAAPVLDDNKNCLGIISLDLLLEAILINHSADQQVQKIMQSGFMELDADDTIPLDLPPAAIVVKDGAAVGMLDYMQLFKAYSRQENEKRLELIAAVDAVETPILSVDNQGRIKIINKWMINALDLDSGCTLDCMATEVIDNREIITLLRRDTIYQDYKMNIKGRNYIPFTKNIILDGEYAGRVLLLRDMSEIEVLVRESEYTKRLNRELEAIIESMFDGLYVTDGQANTLRLNKGFERVMGITADRCVGRNMQELVEEGVFSRSGTLAALDRKERVTISLTASTGKEALVTSNPIYDEEGNVVLVVTNVRDITELNELQRKLERVEGLRERELEAIIESMFDGLYVTDGQAKTLRLNKGFERVMGITADQCVGRNMQELVEEGVFSSSGTLAALEKKEQVTISLTASTGKEALVTSNPIYDENGNVIMVVTNVRDITELNDLQRRLERVESLQELYATELKQLKLQSTRNLVMTSAKMKELVNMVIRVASVDSTVMIQGESGVGKELIAEIIHYNSKRKEGPFIRVNCGAIPDSLLESELFGYEGGAFTGASKNGKPGLFELARGGIIFLDEIGELPLNLQVKLLRVLQDRNILRLGGIEPIKVDCRVIAGTNRNLSAMIDENTFRLDLFYRLNVIPVLVPPLRERREDIPVLMNYFLKYFNQKYTMKKQLDTGVYNVLAEYSWPGNVRELENLMERLVVTCINNIISIKDLPANIKAGVNMPDKNKELMPLKEALEKTERELLESAFARFRSSYQIARVLKINQSTVIRKAQKYGIKH